MMWMPVDMAQSERYISRCVVCEAPSKLYAFHSQDLTFPKCPDGWTSMWPGNSFLLSTGYGSLGGGQQLASPGSCLSNFRSHMFIECTAKGVCGFYEEHKHFWLRVMSSKMEDEMFGMVMPETEKIRQSSQRVAQCNVCMRTQPLMTTLLSQ
jgi:integrin beta 8